MQHTNCPTLRACATQVDDLEDIGALEDYIGRTQMILFYLSKGYFRSKVTNASSPTSRQSRSTVHVSNHSLHAQNCLREVRSSLEMRKPLVLVQEADPTKGGTLQELRAECPEDLQAAIFERTWRLAVWHRIESFQLVSLKIIAEASRSIIERPCCSDSRWLALQ